MTRFFCLYISDFPAWAMLRHEPLLYGKPFAIVAGNRLAAASPEAYAAGVKLGWPVGRAQALVPELIAAPHHAAVVGTAWEDVLAALYGITPRVEPVEPGLAFADVRPAPSPVPLVRAWNAQAGIADDRTTAHLAALSVEPGRVRSVPDGASLAFLNRLSIKLLERAGAAADTVEWCRLLGWTTVGHLRRATRGQLKSQFEDGELLYKYAQAHDIRDVPLYTPPLYLAAHIAFDEPVEEPCDWEAALQQIIDDLLVQLEGRVAHIVLVTVDIPGKRLQQRRLLREGTSSSRVLYAAAHGLVIGLTAKRQPLWRIEISFGGLALPPANQLGLFRPLRPSVRKVLQAIEHRFPGVLKKVVISDPNAYLPERGFKLEPLNLNEQPQEIKTKKAKAAPRSYQKRGKVPVEERTLVMHK